MKRLCPECGEPPQYTSFCTVCAKLFRRPAKLWDRRLAELERRVMQDVSRRTLETAFRQAYSECTSIEELAAKLGRKVSWVQAQRGFLKLPPYPKAPSSPAEPSVWTDELNARLTECSLAGMTLKEAAQTLSKTVYAVKNQAWRLNLKFKPMPREFARKWPVKRVEKLRNLRAARLTFDECAAALGVSRSAIAGAVLRYVKTPPAISLPALEDAHP